MVRTMRTVSSIQMERAKYIYALTIPGFDKNCSETTKEFATIKSTSFVAGEIKGKKLFWHVELMGIKGAIECRLAFDGPDDRDDRGVETDTRVDCCFRIGLGNRRDPFHVGDATANLNSFGEGNRKYCWCDNVTISEIYKQRTILLEDNALQISIEMEVFSKPATLPQFSTPKRKFNSAPELKKMSQDFKDLFESKKFSDIEIRCEPTGEKSFFCHKSILSARSKVFCAMFEQGGMSETETSKVNIPDIRPPILSTILTYIYTGNIVVPETETDPWVELIYGAEKYDLCELKAHCFDVMLDTISDTNVASLAVAAYMYGANKTMMNDIRKYCQTHIARLMRDPTFRKALVDTPKAFYDDDAVAEPENPETFDDREREETEQSSNGESEGDAESEEEEP